MWYICTNLIADNSRNLALSMAAGNATIWKPSPTTPLCSIAVTRIVSGVLERNGIPGAVAGLVTGGKDVGSAVVESKDVDLGKSKSHRNSINLILNADLRLVSFTGSEHVGRIVGKTVMSRFGKVILELGGNNGQFASGVLISGIFMFCYSASVIMPDADLSLAVPAVFFGAVGTAGQRCTSTRRLYLHRQIADEFMGRLKKLYASVVPGDPLDSATLLGPMHTKDAVGVYHNAIKHLKEIDAEIVTGGKDYEQSPLDAGNFVQPTIAIPKSVNPTDQIWSTETFAPILNAAVFDDLEEAIGWNNAVPQVLYSSLCDMQ